MTNAVKTDMRERIIETALQMLEDGGSSALTMRALAAKLGVTPTALYWHFGSRDDLVRAAVDRLAGRLTAARVRGATSHERVFWILRNVRSVSDEHPNVARVAFDMGITARLQMPWQRVLARELSAAGLAGRRLADVMRGLLYTTAGFVVIDSQLRQGALGSEAEWSTIEEGTVDVEAQRVLSAAPDVDALFRATVMSLIEELVPTPSR